MQIPFCGATYNGRSTNIDASRSVNFYPELTGTQDNKSQMVMVGTPGLSPFLLSIAAQTAPIRGMYTFNGVIYAVISNKLYSITTGGTVTARGTLTTSNGRVEFRDNGIASNGVGGNQLMVVDGTDGYVYNASTTAFTTISDVNFPATPKHLEYIDGYFVVIDGTMNHYTSDLYDGTSWNGLAYASVLATSDPIVSVVNHRQQLFFMKTLSTEVWYNSGTPTTQGSPFARVSGAVYDFGVASEWSVAKGGNSFYFLCTQRTQDGGEVVGVAEITEYQPQIISTPAINYKIAQSTTHVNCFGYCYSEEGHMFYVLTNPTDNWTIVYDASTKMWHERSSLTTSVGTVNRHLSNCYTFCGGVHYVGDYRAANIYMMSTDYNTDNGVPIYSWRTAQTIIDRDVMDDISISELMVDAETGIGTNTPVTVPVVPYPAGWNGSANVLILADGSITAGAIIEGVSNPMAYLSWSKDSGHTWSDERGVALGREGEFNTRLVWRQLGRARNKVFRLRISDPVPKIIINAFIEGGR